jgi:NAD(P)-dependent dehydrogenase (short-subunit alcohol dehydrogenase family)
MARKKLQGQVAIITGGSRGIGAAAAEMLAMAGARVVVTARGEDQVQAVTESIRKQGGQAIGVAADVSDPEQAEELVEAALTQYDRVDILVNNAAVIWPLEEAAETDPEEWAYAIHVNLIAPFYLIRNVLPLMLAQGSGRIVNVSSGAAVSPILGGSAYCASKAGLDMLTRVIAKETDGKGVSINALYPGMVDTDMQADIRSVDTSETTLDFSRWHQAYEQQQLLPASDPARMIYWLSGPWSRGRSGEIFKSTDTAWLRQVREDTGE